jgi:hypothetical protein
MRAAYSINRLLRAKEDIDAALEDGEDPDAYLDHMGEEYHTLDTMLSAKYMMFQLNNIYRRFDPIVWNSVIAVTPQSGAIDLGAYLHGMITKQTSPRPIPRGGWTLVGQCKGGGPGNGWVVNTPTMTGSFANNCLAGQAGVEIFDLDAYTAANNSGLIRGQWNAARDRYQHIVNYSRNLGNPSATTTHRYHPTNGINRIINPNIHRLFNPTPQPLGITSPRSRPAENPNFHRIVEIVGGPRQGVSPGVARAARSQPPKAGTKERKSKAAQLGAAAFNVLDKISEGSEVVDAIYQALPGDVRRRWNNNERRGAFSKGDNAGQYGIDGADWKLRALYHNWDKVNINTALKNILANELEDRLYGAAYKARDNVTFRGRKRPRRHT